jgi:phosphoadenosine phosphosulfate reductase
MPPDIATLRPTDRLAPWNHAARVAQAEAVLDHALTTQDLGQLALVSSFGAESVVLLHMVARVARDLPVLFVDTELLFPETLAYQEGLAQHLGLTGIRRIRPDAQALAQADPDGTLRLRDPDACCALRKTATLDAALNGFGAWITGRKRFQADTRQNLDFYASDAAGRITINPLVQWDRANIAAYLDDHALPRHPLVARGYLSIGCAPCTTPVVQGEDDRAGRWRGLDKVECGIHFADGHLKRGAAA